VGTRTLESGSSLSGSGTLDVQNGTLNANGSLGLAASGQIYISGGTLNLDTTGTAVTLANPLTITSGTLNTADALTVGTFNWAGGILTGSGKLITPLGSTSTLTTTSDKRLQSTTWDNAGTVNLAEGSLYLYGYGSGTQQAAAPVFNNTGTVNVSSRDYDPIYGYSYLSGTPTVNNAGTLNWNASYSTQGYGDIQSVAFNNSGTVNVNDGLRLVASAGTDTGTYNIASGKSLVFESGVRSFSSSGQFVGAGSVSFSLASTTFSQTQIVTSGTNLAFVADAGPVTIGSGGVAPQNGTLSFDQSGVATYTPNNGFAGQDSFSYEVIDSAGKSFLAQVSVLVVASGGLPIVYVTATNLQKVYGDTDPGLTYTVSASESVGLTGNLLRAAGENVGTYSIGQGSLACAVDCALTVVTGSFTIVPRPITVTANAQSMVYGATVPSLSYGLTAGDLVNGDSLNGSLISVASPTANAGTYAIGQGDLTAGTNYALSYVGNNLTITPRPITVTANNLSRVYGDANPTTGAVLLEPDTPLVNNDQIGLAALSSTATVTTPVGSVALSPSALSFTSGQAGNYDVSYLDGFLAITPRPITVTADAKSMVYGDALPTMTYAISGRGLVSGDSLSGMLSTPANSTANVGNYTIDQGDLAASGNYALSYVGNGIAITPRSITVKANDISRPYGDVNPANGAVTVVQGNLANGETMGLAQLSSPADTSTSIGSYALNASGLAFAAGSATNYTISYQSGTLTISRRLSSSWVGGASGNWSNPANWDAVPTANNVANVNIASSSTVNYDVSGVSLDSLTSAGRLIIDSANTLDVSNALSTFGFSQSAGNVNAGSFTATDNFNQTGGTIKVSGHADITQTVGNLTATGLLQSSSLALNAESIGAAGAPVLTQTRDLTFNASLGSAYITNNSPGRNLSPGLLNVSGTANGEAVIVNYGETTVPALATLRGITMVELVANSPLNINGSVSSSGQVTLTAANPGNLSIGGSITGSPVYLNAPGGSVSGNIPAGAFITQAVSNLAFQDLLANTEQVLADGLNGVESGTQNSQPVLPAVEEPVLTLLDDSPEVTLYTLMELDSAAQAQALEEEQEQQKEEQQASEDKKTESNLLEAILGPKSNDLSKPAYCPC
jgi:hypothetical protein